MRYIRIERDGHYHTWKFYVRGKVILKQNCKNILLENCKRNAIKYAKIFSAERVTFEDATLWIK